MAGRRNLHICTQPAARLQGCRAAAADQHEAILTLNTVIGWPGNVKLPPMQNMHRHNNSAITEYLGQGRHHHTVPALLPGEAPHRPQRGRRWGGGSRLKPETMRSNVNCLHDEWLRETCCTGRQGEDTG